MRYLVPFDGSGLIFGYNIADIGVNFLQGVTGADQHIIECRNAVLVGDGVCIHFFTAHGRSVQMEFNARIQSVLGGFGHFQRAALELIAESHGCGLTADNGHTPDFLRHILVAGLLGDGVHAGHQIVDLYLAVGSGGDGLAHAVAIDGEGNALHVAVLRGFDNLSRAEADLDLGKAVDLIRHGLGVGNDVLLAAPRSDVAVRPSDNAHALRVALAGRNGHGTAGRGGRGDFQLVTADRKFHIAVAGRKRTTGQNIVGVGQFQHILTAVPRHFIA